MKQPIEAKWHDAKRWTPIDRTKAARMIRGNRRHPESTVTRSGSEIYFSVRGYDAALTIRPARQS